MIKAQKFNYDIVEVFPLSDLEKFKDHRRMMVFYNKGCKCVTPGCDKVGTQLAFGVDHLGNRHIDVYDDDFYPLTVDHILPKSLGGHYTLENLQPMCYNCNNKKGNGIPRVKIKVEDPNTYTKEGIQVGDEVYTKGGKRGRKYKYQGIVDSFCINPNTGRESALMVNGTSMHRRDVLFKVDGTKGDDESCFAPKGTEENQDQEHLICFEENN